MASGTFYPAVQADDGSRYGTSNFTIYNYLTLGQVGSVPRHLFVRFPNVTIPEGVTITSAFIRFTAQAAGSATVCNEELSFNDVDNAVAPTSYSEYDALVKTTAKVDWTAIGAWSTDVQYDSVDIKTALQEVIDRAGWSSGNAVMLLGDGTDSDASAHRQADVYDGTGKAELHVTWIADTNITAEPLNAISSLSAVPQVQLNLTNNPFQVVSSLEVADIYRGRFIVAEEFNSTATLNSTVQIKLLPQPFEAAASLVSSLQLGINALPFEAASELLSGLFVGKTLAAEEFTANSELAGNTQVQLVPPSLSAVSSLSSDILFGLSVTDFEGVSSLDSIVTLLHRSSLTLINGIRFGSDLNLINSLNLDINSQLVLVNDILTGLTGDLILKMDINELAKLNDALTLINNINDENSGVSQGPFYFLKSHGL